MEGLNIELAKENDIPGMLKLWRDTPGVGLGVGDDDTSLAAFIQRNPNSCLLMKFHDSIIGTVLGGFDGRRGYIYHLVIHRDFRRRGYGKKLLQEVVMQLEALNAGKIHLFVFNSNFEAIAFYEKQGWLKRKDIKIFSLNTTK
ncbi:MAG: GNAT family N-acetyltransferase [Syntrophomonadaceae bacterium]|jgi:ribosomal protein S18 acetylase RimI-like enzyme